MSPNKILGKLNFSKQELKDLGISALALAFIFSFSFNLFKDPLSFIYTYTIYLILIILSFIPHELSHKFTAIHYGYYARYEVWKHGLYFALFLAVITNGKFIFAAPGAVMIYSLYHSRKSRKQITKENGMISLAGPLSNLIISLLAFIILSAPLSLTKNMILILTYLFKINAFLAFFNLLPIPPFDGSKIIWWNIPIWVITMITSIILYFNV